jgi:hypothetical protein
MVILNSFDVAYVKRYAFVEHLSRPPAQMRNCAGEHGLIQFRQFVIVALSNGPGVDAP